MEPVTAPLLVKAILGGAACVVGVGLLCVVVVVELGDWLRGRR